jgi:hypothetical protein
MSMNAELLNNTNWVDNDNVYYQFYGMYKDGDDITGIVRKSNKIPVDTHTDSSMDDEFHFTIIPVKEAYQILSHLFTDPYELFDMTISNSQIVISSESSTPLLLNRVS